MIFFPIKDSINRGEMKEFCPHSIQVGMDLILFKIYSGLQQ